MPRYEEFPTEEYLRALGRAGYLDEFIAPHWPDRPNLGPAEPAYEVCTRPLCAHNANAHGHHSAATNCVLCDCPRFTTMNARWFDLRPFIPAVVAALAFAIVGLLFGWWG